MNISNFKSTYGYIGFLPFAFLSIAPWIAGSEISKVAIVFQLAYGSIILTFLGGMSWGWRDEQQNQKFNLFPCKDNIFRCFNYFDIENTKIVILGQDPYHGPNQATGLCFETNKNCKKK